MANIGIVEGTIRLRDEFLGVLARVAQKSGQDMGRIARNASEAGTAIADLERKMAKLAKAPSLRADAASSAKSLAAIRAENRAIEENIVAIRKGPAAVQALANEREVMNRLLAAGVTRESAYGREIEKQIRLQQKYRQDLDQANDELERQGRAAEMAAARLQKMGAGLSSVGSTLTRAVTLPLVAVGGGAVKLASDFESSFAGIRKTVNATETQFAALAQGMRDLSKEIPVNVNELNRIGEAAGQLGIETENILDFTRVMANLGVATNLSSDEAATALARLANITQLPQTEFDRLGSTIVALGNNFATTEAEIVQMGLRVAGAGKQIGLTEGQILAVATALSSVGIEAEAGGSAISKVMINIALAASKGGTELQQFAAVAGMSSREFQAAFRDDAATAVNAFIQGLGRMQEAGGNVLGTLEAMGIIEVRMRDALLRASGAGDLLTRALKLQGEAWEENTALTTEAEQRYKTFESQLTLFWNRLKDVGITLGTALLPALRDTLTALQPAIDTLASLAAGFAGLSPGAQKAILALGAVAAAVGPTLFITGQLITAWGSLAGAAPKLAAGIASVARQLVLLNPVLTVTLGLLVALNEAVKIWGERSSVAMADMVASTNRVGAAVADLRKGLQEGEISAGALERAREAARALGDEIGRVGREINKKNAEMGSLSADALVLQREEVAKLEKEFARLGADRSNLERFLRLAEGLPVVLEDAGGAAEGAAGPPGGITQMSDALRDALRSIAHTTAEQEALLKALADSQDAYDTLNLLLEMGVPLNDALSGKYDAQAQKLLALQKTMAGLIAKRERAKELAAESIKLEDELNKVIQETLDLATSGALGLEIVIDPDALEAITRGAEAVGQAVQGIRREEQLRVEALREINRLLEAGLITQEEAREVTEQMNLATNEMAEALETMMKRAWENIQDAAAGAISGIFKDLIDTGNDAIDRLLHSFIDMLAELLVIWAANAAKRAAMEQGVAQSGNGMFGGGGGGGNIFGSLARLFGLGGGGAAGFGSGVGAAGNAAFGGGTGAMTNAYWAQYTNATASGISQGIGGASWGTLGVMFGTAAAAVIIADFAQGWSESQDQKRTAGTIRFGPQEMAAFSGDSALNDAMVGSLEALQAMFRELEILTGASLDILDQVVINVKGNNRIWVNIGNWFTQEVESMEEALDLVVTQLVQRSNVVGGSPAIRAALENFTGSTIDELNESIAAALRSEELFLGQEGAAAIRQRTSEFFELLQEEIELGLIEAQGGSGALTGLVRSYQENHDRLLGIQRDVAEQARVEARAHNAALAMDRARLEMMRAEILATGAAVQAAGGFVNGMVANARAMHAGTIATGGMAQATAAGANVAATAARVQAGLGQVMAAGGQAAAANAEAQGALAQTQIAGAQVASAAAQAHAAALEAINEALALLEGLDVDIEAAAAAARRAGGGNRRADMESLRDLIDQMRFDRLLADMTDLEAGLARLEREYQDNLERAHGNAELVAQLTEEYRLQEEQLRRNIQLSAVDTFQAFLGIGADPFSGLREQWEEAQEAVEEAGFGADRAARMLRRVNRAYEVQLDILSRQQFVSIGDNLLGFLERYYGGVEGFEEVRMAIERTRFELELMLARQRFEILKAEGTLAAAVLAEMQRVFDFIDANPIDWDKFVTPDLAAPPVERFREAASAMNNALEEMVRRLRSAQDGIRDFLLGLQRGELGGRSNEDMFNAALAQFQELAAQPGNIQAQEDFPEVARRLAEIARERFGSTAEFQNILDMIEGTGLDFLDVTRVSEDNVVFDQRFLDAQRMQLEVDRQGHQNVANAIRESEGKRAADEERSREELLQALRDLRQEQAALNNRLAAIEARKRTEKAA